MKKTAYESPLMTVLEILSNDILSTSRIDGDNDLIW